MGIVYECTENFLCYRQGPFYLGFWVYKENVISEGQFGTQISQDSYKNFIQKLIHSLLLSEFTRKSLVLRTCLNTITLPRLKPKALVEITVSCKNQESIICEGNMNIGDARNGVDSEGSESELSPLWQQIVEATKKTNKPWRWDDRQRWKRTERRSAGETEYSRRNIQCLACRFLSHWYILLHMLQVTWYHAATTTSTCCFTNHHTLGASAQGWLARMELVGSGWGPQCRHQHWRVG